MKASVLTGGISNSKLDLAGCVLNAPLWRPDQAGSSIVSKPPLPQTLTVYGAAWRSQGRYFDSDDYITVPDSVSLRPASLTVEAWIRRTNYGGATQGVLTKTYQTLRNSFELTISSTQLYFLVLNANGSTQHLAPMSSPAYDTWWHVAGTYDGTTLRTYLDGTEGASAAGGTAIPYAAQVLQIGAGYYNGIGSYWLGTIGEVRIYNRVLSIFELRRNFQATRGRYK